jgi:phosphonate dehydrogenase
MPGWLRALNRLRLRPAEDGAATTQHFAPPNRPLGIDPGLLASLRTLFAPHPGSAVARVRAEIALAAARNIADVLEGRRPRDAVNEPEGLSLRK